MRPLQEENGPSGAVPIAMVFPGNRVCSNDGPREGPPLVWKTSVAGQGYSSLSISEGRIFTQGARGDREFVIAIDVATGKLLWETVSGRRFGNNRGDGPRGTPTLDGDRVYALGANGDLSCLEISTGRKIWAVNLLEEFGGSNIRWGISESPLVLGDRVLVNAGGPDSSIVALNKMDGSLIWKSQSDKAGYSSAVPLEINGVTQAIFFTGIRALGVDVRDGLSALGIPEGVKPHRQYRHADCARQPRVRFLQLRDGLCAAGNQT